MRDQRWIKSRLDGTRDIASESREPSPFNKSADRHLFKRPLQSSGALLWPLIILVALYVLYRTQGPIWATTGAIAGLFAMAAVGLDLIAGYAGRISLGQGGFMAIGAYTSAILTVRFGWPPLGAAFSGIGLSLVIATTVGTVLLRLKEIYFAMATLAFALAVPAIITATPSFSGGPQGLYGVRVLTVGSWSMGNVRDLYVTAWILAGLMAWGVRRISRSRSGIVSRLLNENSDVAEASGVASAHLEQIYFVLSAIPASIAGSLYAMFIVGITPDAFGLTLLLPILTYSVVGGMGTGWGPLVGGVVVNLMIVHIVARSGTSTDLIYGAAFLLIIIGIPSGIIGTVKVISRRMHRRFSISRPVDTDEIEVTGDKSITGNPTFSTENMDGAANGSIVNDDVHDFSATNSSPVLSVRNVSISFGPVAALNDVSLDLFRGEIHCVVGPNGAGKSTLLNVINGFVKPANGDVMLENSIAKKSSAHGMAQLGVARTFQAPRLSEKLSIVDNVAVGAYRLGNASIFSSLFLQSGCTELASLRKLAEDQLERVGLSVDLEVGLLSFGQKRIVELARALVMSPKVLLLDEPLSGLDTGERSSTVLLIRTIVDSGIAVCLVEHDVESVVKIADRISVLDRGSVIATGKGSSVFNEQHVKDAFFGRPTLSH